MNQFFLYNPQRRQRYYPVAALDQGGFGIVWAGYIGVLPVAIKVIKPTSNFLRDWATWDVEQRIHLICLAQQHIVQTYDQFVTPDGHLVLVMERAEGNLQNVVDRGHRYVPKDVCAIACQLLTALDYLHSIGIMHRDVTLKNILLFNGGIFKLSDFGISRMDMSPDELARTFIGHSSYIPPELFAGYSSFQSDLYQLGLVLLALLTGRHPIPLNADISVTKPLIEAGIPRQTAELLIPTFGRTAEIIAMMLRRTPAYRYATAAGVYQDFHSEYYAIEAREKVANALMMRNALGALGTLACYSSTLGTAGKT